MQLNLIGLVAATAAFLSIWWGHVAVRKIESVSERLWPAMAISILLGIGCEVIAAWADNLYLTAACGIVGVVFIWDAFEFYRQQKRIKRGHASANLRNPRHVKILAEYPDATTLDWLDRSPQGKPYSAEELAAMKASAK